MPALRVKIAQVKHWGDGKNPITSEYKDTNRDGKVDMILQDTNNDGQIDKILKDTNHDGNIDELREDKDYDGKFETIVKDTDHDGRSRRAAAGRAELLAN